MTEIKAKNGMFLTQKNDVGEDRVYITAIKGMNVNADDWRDATVEERAKRRYKELIAKGEDVKYEDVLREMIERDNNDRNRDVAPAVPAEDAVMMDNSHMSIEENVDAVVELVRSKGIEI
jgi:cytidylate kinase